MQQDFDWPSASGGYHTRSEPLAEMTLTVWHNEVHVVDFNLRDFYYEWPLSEKRRTSCTAAFQRILYRGVKYFMIPFWLHRHASTDHRNTQKLLRIDIKPDRRL